MTFGVGHVGCDECCATCEDVFSDDFNRTDSSTIGNSWNETAGNWAISSNKLTVPTANAQLSKNTSSLFSSSVPYDGARFEVDVSSDTAGDQLYVGVVKSDGSGHVAAVTFATGAGNGTVKLYQRTVSGFVYTYIERTSTAVTAEPGSTYRLGVTANNAFYSVGASTVQTVSAIFEAAVVGGAVRAASGGDRVELGTRTLTGVPTFDNFTAAKVIAPCPDVDCCWPFLTNRPAQIQAVIAGMADGESTGCDCATNYNGTYVLDLVTDLTGITFQNTSATSMEFCSVYRYTLGSAVNCDNSLGSPTTVDALWVLIESVDIGGTLGLCNAWLVGTPSTGGRFQTTSMPLRFDYQSGSPPTSANWVLTQFTGTFNSCPSTGGSATATLTPYP